ncbi:MAG: hypothetical protein GY845_30230, partial [Planctomycetes bacterium]|nr:hypothetical protein [Planctomycetota bacterium]
MLTASILTIFGSIFFDYSRIVRAFSVGAAGMLGSLWLTRRGYLRFAGLLVLLLFLGILDYLLYTADGIHDIAVVAYPIVIIIAGLLLGKRAYVAYTILVILSLYGIIFGELNGLIVNTFSRFTSEADFVFVSVILFVTAVSARSLSDNIAQNIAKARSSQRALAESNRKLQREIV